MYSIHYTATMKNKNILILIISFIILLVACSALSMSAVASNYRYTWVAMNPWNGVEGIAFTVGYLQLLKTTEIGSFDHPVIS